MPIKSQEEIAKNMKTLEFTCTHVIQRHNLLRQTIDSMVSNINGVDFSNSTIYINMDQAPTRILSDEDSTLDYLNKIFGRVVAHQPSSPNFTKAIHWCWSQPKEELFFHLEDDWVLREKVGIDDMLKYFEDSKVFALNLRAYSFKNPRPCLLQSLWRKSFCEEFLNTLDFQRNPENQLRSFVKGTEYYNIHYPKGIDDIIVEDIGREWLRNKGLQRNHISSRFINYR